jgi:hypothetical protein
VPIGVDCANEQEQQSDLNAEESRHVDGANWAQGLAAFSAGG